MKYACKDSNGLKVNDFSVYDIKIVQPDEKRKSRLKLPIPEVLFPVKPSPQLPKEKAPGKKLEPETTASPVKESEKKESLSPIKEATEPPQSIEQNIPQTTPVSNEQPASAPRKTTPAKSKPEPMASAEPEFVPQKKSAQELSRRDYKDVQEDIVERISRRKKLKDVLPDYQNIPMEDVILDKYYAHEKGGTVYEYRIPSKQLRVEIRIFYMGNISIKSLEEFYINNKRIELYE